MGGNHGQEFVEDFYDDISSFQKLQKYDTLGFILLQPQKERVLLRQLSRPITLSFFPLKPSKDKRVLCLFLERDPQVSSPEVKVLF